MYLPEVSGSPAIKQADGLVSPSVGRAPATSAGGAGGPLSLGKLECDVLVDALLEDTEILVQDAEEDDGEEGEGKLEVRVDVPGLEDDAGVDDLGVPEHVHRAHRHRVSTVVHDDGSSSSVERLRNDYVYSF